MTLSEGLKAYQKRGYRSFHTPGHKGRRDFFAGLDFPEQDLTELPGLDMLHAPQGIIAEAQKRAARIFGAEESFFLINGATVGNQAMFLSLSNVTGKKVIIERQSHRSVMSALVLTGLVPEYLPPVVHPDFNLPLGLGLGKLESLMDGASACHLTYPSYYGTTADLPQLIQTRNIAAPAMSVLVDQAHGSHYLSELFPPSALCLGADLVLHSTHKTLGALTQAAMLHIQGKRIDLSRLRQALDLLQSSSPSYLLMASLERAAEQALITGVWAELHSEVQGLYEEVGAYLRILKPEDAGKYGIMAVDWSKILVNTRALGLSAAECVEHLRKNYLIEPELWDEENILFMLGIGNTVEDVQVLTKGLKSLIKLKPGLSVSTVKHKVKDNCYSHPAIWKGPYPPLRISPREAYLAHKREVPLKESRGLIAGESISPYPPGIPVIVMGEEITPEVIEYLEQRKEGNWQGWSKAGNKILVVEEGSV